MTSEPHSRPVYMDHAATSWPKPDSVRRAMDGMFTQLSANAGRSGHGAAVDAARRVFRVRERLALLIGADRSEDIVFTSGATEGLNLVLKGFLQEGDLVFVSPLEHNAVMRPLEALRQTRHVEWRVLPADSLGRVIPERISDTPGIDRAALVAICHGSNVNGVVQDIEAIRRELPDEVALLVDAAQTAGTLPIDVAGWRLDFLACSAHKGLLAPTGLGACYLAHDREVRPLVEGGTGSRSEELEMPELRPDRYEAGTLNLHGIAGLEGGLDELSERGLLGEHKRNLSTHLIRELDSIPNVQVQSPTDGSALLASFTIEGVGSDEVARKLESRFGVLCRPGLHCAPMAHLHLGTWPRGTVRLSPGWGSRSEDIERVIEGVCSIARGAA